MGPMARKRGLVVEVLEDETVIYDTERDRIHCLNPTAAFVLRHCDGRTSPRSLARRLRERFGFPADERTVGYTLEKLEEARLLETSSAVSGPHLSRRELTRRLGLVGGLGFLVPAVTSIIAPTPAAAATCKPRGACCSSQAECCPGLNCVGPRACNPGGKQCF
jgi:hypothetical protein